MLVLNYNNKDAVLLGLTSKFAKGNAKISELGAINSSLPCREEVIKEKNTKNVILRGNLFYRINNSDRFFGQMLVCKRSSIARKAFSAEEAIFLTWIVSREDCFVPAMTIALMGAVNSSLSKDWLFLFSTIKGLQQAQTDNN